MMVLVVPLASVFIFAMGFILSFIPWLPTPLAYGASAIVVSFYLWYGIYYVEELRMKDD